MLIKACSRTKITLIHYVIKHVQHVAHSASRLSHYVIKHVHVRSLSNDSQDTGDALQRSEVLATSFIPSRSRAWLCRTSPWPSRYVVVLNRSGHLRGRHFHRLATLAKALAIASCRMNSHANQPGRRDH